MPGKRIVIFAAICALGAWLCCGVFGHPLTHLICARFNSQILRFSDGKFTNPERFVEMRLHEAAVIVTGAALLVLIHAVAVGLVNRKFPGRWSWVLMALSGFICVNLLAWLAAGTTLFWCLLFTGVGQTDNYTQYQIKRYLMREPSAPKQAVFFGSSQVRAEIDPIQINRTLGTQLWTTSLFFPGNKAYNLLLSLESLPPVKVDYVVCYLSEGDFFTGSPPGMTYFFGIGDLPEFYALGGAHAEVAPYFGYGLLGDVVPLFRLRDSMLGRIYGPRITALKQEEWDASLKIDLADRAKTAAASYSSGAGFDFQKKAFCAFADECRKRQAVLIVCSGQLNPILEGALNPSMRPDMLAFLREQAAKDTNMVLLNPAELPSQSENDYDDLTHVNMAARARFSDFIAGILEKQMGLNTPANQKAP